MAIGIGKAAAFDRYAHWRQGPARLALPFALRSLIDAARGATA